MKFFENISVNPEDVKDLKELIPLSIDQDEDFQRFTTLRKVKHGDPLGYLGEGNMVGKAGSGCDPTYEEYGVANAQKRWQLGDWQIPLKICYDSLQGTIAEYTLKNGTEIGDLTTTEFFTYIIRPALERQMKLMIWRFGWFGDTAAKNIADGGSLTDGVNADFFKTADGLFKRIFAQCAEHSNQLTAIAANAEASWTEQRSEMLRDGVATTLLDTMLMDADSRITMDGNAVVMMTKAMADALTWDVKKTYKTIMPWETVFNGLDITQYNGVTIARVSIWDRMIRAFEKSGDKPNKPFRMVYANTDQLLIGTPQDSLISDLDIWFDKKERRNYIYATGKIGTNILEDDMFHAAY